MTPPWGRFSDHVIVSTSDEKSPPSKARHHNKLCRIQQELQHRPLYPSWSPSCNLVSSNRSFTSVLYIGKFQESGTRHAKPTLFLLFELRCLYYAYPYHDVASVSKGIIFPEHRLSLLTTRSRSRFEGLSSSRLKCAERGSIDHGIRAITVTECVWLMGCDVSPPEPNIRFSLFISDDPIPSSGPSSTSEYIANAFHTSLTWRIGIF